MVAYSFKSRFAEPILDGRKGGTIRASRKWRYGVGRHAEVGGHAFPGEDCRPIARKACLAVDPITLDFVGAVEWPADNRLIHLSRDLDTFAAFDGFHCWDELIEFWAETHNADKFHGWHIRWMELPQMGWTRA